MEINRCSRCGNFYVSGGAVCPKCTTKDEFEFGTLKNYVKENGFENSLNTISCATGISVKNLNRFIGYPEFQSYQQKLNSLDEITNGIINIENN